MQRFIFAIVIGNPKHIKTNIIFIGIALAVLSFLPFISPSEYNREIVLENSYIETHKSLALQEMKMHQIPACITLAQAVLESSSGRSELARNANNHFGIKCKSDWKGKTYLYNDDREKECFRAYNSVEESYRDHSLFLKKQRYKDLFKLDINDYVGWAKGLKACGYATNPEYGEKLIKIITTHKLYEIK